MSAEPLELEAAPDVVEGVVVDDVPDAVREAEADDVPGLDWAGSLVVRQSWVQPVGAMAGTGFVGACAAAAMAAGGWATPFGLLCGCLAVGPAWVAAGLFERRVLGNRRYRWGGHPGRRPELASAGQSVVRPRSLAAR